MKKNDFKSTLFPEKVFLFFSIFIGLILLVLAPPFETPDEDNHFNRAFQLTELELLGERTDSISGGNMPVAIEQMIANLMGEEHSIGISHHFHIPNKDSVKYYLKYKQDLTPKKMVDFRNTVLYSPVIYFPQSIGMSFGRALHLPPLWYLYLGRLFNLAFFILVGFFSIKYTPIHKWLFVLLLLMPMSIFQAASLSADVVTIALSFLIIGYIFYLVFGDQVAKIQHRQMLFISLLAFFLGLSKFVYVFIPLLVILIPSDKYISKKSALLYKVIVITSSMLGFGIWSLIVRDLYLPIFDYLQPYEQLMYSITHPIEIFERIMATISRDLNRSFVGNFGWLNVPLPMRTVYIFDVVLILIAILDNNKININVYQKITGVVLFVFSVLLMQVVIYCSWDRVGAEMMTGIQGRYFIPIVLLLLMSLYNNKFKNNITDKLPYLVVISLLYVYVETIRVFLLGYYL